jgi:hypothetical protein
LYAYSFSFPSGYIVYFSVDYGDHGARGCAHRLSFEFAKDGIKIPINAKLLISQRLPEDVLRAFGELVAHPLEQPIVDTLVG